MDCEHETYLTFDSKFVENKGDYRLEIKTTPRDIISFEIITAFLPRIVNTRYLVMKIQNIDNTVSLHDESMSGDNAFAKFYFLDDTLKFSLFHQDDVHPNTLHFQNPLCRLPYLHIKWFDEWNKQVHFNIPRFSKNDLVYYYTTYDDSHQYKHGIITKVFVEQFKIEYEVHNVQNRNEIATINEVQVMQHSVNDNVMIKQADNTYKKAIVLRTQDNICTSYYVIDDS